MGGRSSLGGTRSTYRRDSTAQFRARQLAQQQGGIDNTGSGYGGGGGGGGSTDFQSGGTSTGGIEGGGGSGGSGGSVTDTDTNKPEEQTTDINDQDFSELTDDELKDLFEETEDYERFLERDISESAYSREYNNAFTRWVQSQSPSGDDDDDGPVDVPDVLDPIEADFHLDVPEEDVAEIEAQMLKMPERIRDELKKRGITVNVAKRADEHDKWAEYEAATGRSSTDTISDDRELGTLSFYNNRIKTVFISTDHKGGSANVMVHEMSHGVDGQWLEDYVDVPFDRNGAIINHPVIVISRDDPEWIELHEDYLKPVKDVDDWFDYFVGGPSGDNDESGRAELFAEGMAAYFEGGTVRLRSFLFNGIKDDTDRYHVADTMISIWRRYGIIE